MLHTRLSNFGPNDALMHQRRLLGQSKQQEESLPILLGHLNHYAHLVSAKLAQRSLDANERSSMMQTIRLLEGHLESDNRAVQSQEENSKVGTSSVATRLRAITAAASSLPVAPALDVCCWNEVAPSLFPKRPTQQAFKSNGLFEILPDNLIIEILSHLKARCLSYSNCVKALRGGIHGATKLSFQATFGSLRVIQPDYEHNAEWKSIVVVEDAVAIVAAWETTEIVSSRRWYSEVEPSNLYQKLDNLNFYDSDSSISIQGVSRIDDIQTLACSLVLVINKHLGDNAAEQNIQDAAGRALSQTLLDHRFKIGTLSGFEAVLKAGFIQSLSQIMENIPCSSGLYRIFVELLSANVYPLRVLAAEKKEEEKKAAAMNVRYKDCLLRCVLESELMEKFVASHSTQIDLYTRLLNAHPALMAHFEHLVRDKAHIEEFVQIFNMEVFQKGLEDTDTANDDSNSPPQISFIEEAPATVALAKWVPFFFILRSREEIRKKLCRAGIIEIISNILDTARSPKTADEEDQIDSLKSLSRYLIASD